MWRFHVLKSYKVAGNYLLIEKYTGAIARMRIRKAGWNREEGYYERRKGRWNIRCFDGGMRKKEKEKEKKKKKDGFDIIINSRNRICSSKEHNLAVRRSSTHCHRRPDLAQR